MASPDPIALALTGYPRLAPTLRPWLLRVQAQLYARRTGDGRPLTLTLTLTPTLTPTLTLTVTPTPTPTPYL